MREMVFMKDFRQLCEMIVKRNGNPSCQDIIDCGFGVEGFIVLAQSRISTDKLLEEAKKFLELTEEIV